MEKLSNIAGMIKFLMERNFTGFIKISFNSGAIRRVERFEEILK